MLVLAIVLVCSSVILGLNSSSLNTSLNDDPIPSNDWGLDYLLQDSLSVPYCGNDVLLPSCQSHTIHHKKLLAVKIRLETKSSDH